MDRPYLLRVLSLLLVFILIRPDAEARQPVYGRKAMVVAQEELAADVGLSVLQSGGNAVDAAVTVGFALAVTHPFAGRPCVRIARKIEGAITSGLKAARDVSAKLEAAT
jgi:gamma-glutamyltranspeptidase/glutathione hydrolase